jgi:uncharacterized membrane protein YidH (DUF202 family)
VAQNKTNAMSLISGTLSLVFAISSLYIDCIGVFSILFGIADAVMGFLARKNIDDSGGQQSGRKMAVIGMIMGLVGIVLSIGLTLLGMIFNVLVDDPVIFQLF